MILTTAAYKKRIGASIRALRVIGNESQDTFAARLKMHRTYYSAIERGEKNLTIATLARICRLHNQPISDVIAVAEKLPAGEIK